MELSVEWTDEGLVLRWPHGELNVRDADRISARLPDGQVALLTRAGVTLRDQGTTPDLPRLVVPDADRPLGSVLADALALLMADPAVTAAPPFDLDTLERLLRTRTALPMQDVTSRVLKTVLRADARFEQIQQGRWMLASVSHLERLGHLRRAPLPLVQGPPAWDRHAPPEFDPMSPDHPAAEYVAFLMAQPDVSLPVLTSTLMTLLRTRTAAPVALINRAVLTDALQADPRFTALSGRRWDLASPHRLRLSSKTSLIQHVRAVMALPDVRLPLSTWALAELLTTRTTLDPARCKFTSLQSALTRDPYFYRVEVGLWTRSDTPLTPEDKARLEAHLPSRGRADPLKTPA